VTRLRATLQAIGIMKEMKSLQLLLLTPLACLLAQTPPASHPAAPPASAVQPAKPPAMALQPPAPVAPNVPPETVVLTVGDEKMTAGEIDRLIDTIPPQYRAQMRNPAGRRQFAERIVQLKVMAQEARRRKIEDTPEYKEQLALQIDQVLAQQYYKNLQATTKVDEAAARKYYDEHKSDYEQVKASHILIRVKGSPRPGKKDAKELTDEEALAKAKEIRQKLVDGADFAKLAEAESDDTGSAAKGGDLGLFGRHVMAAPFEEVAFTIPVGQLSEPVKTQFGYHIIKVESREDKSFAEVRPEIERKLEAEQVKKTLDDLKASTPVVMNPDYFGSAPAPAAMVPPAAKPPATVHALPTPTPK